MLRKQDEPQFRVDDHVECKMQMLKRIVFSWARYPSRYPFDYGVTGEPIRPRRGKSGLKPGIAIPTL